MMVPKCHCEDHAQQHDTDVIIHDHVNGERIKKKLHLYYNNSLLYTTPTPPVNSLTNDHVSILNTCYT